MKLYEMSKEELLKVLIPVEEENVFNIPRYILENGNQKDFLDLCEKLTDLDATKDENGNVNLSLRADLKSKIAEILDEDESLKPSLYLTMEPESVLKSFNSDEYNIISFWNLSRGYKLQNIHDRISEQIKVSLDHPLKVKDREWVLLVGGSGTGKTTAAIQYAKEKGLDYVLMSATMNITDSDFKGFRSITTHIYQESLLKDAVVNGKVFIIDEIDAADKNTLLILNSLKNGIFQFEDESVEVHPNFRLIATANAIEYNEKYSARTPMDLAILERFQLLEYIPDGPELSLELGHDFISTTPKDCIDRILNDGKIYFTVQTLRGLRRAKINTLINQELGRDLLPLYLGD